MNAPAPIDAETLARRRRAILHALSAMLPRDKALEAIAMWNRDYRHGRSAFDGLNLFARQVCAKFDRVGLHIELLQRLTQAFYVDERELPVDPGPATQAPDFRQDAAQEPPAVAERGDDEARDMATRPPADAQPRSRHAPPPETATWLALVRRLARELAPHDGPAAASMQRAILAKATASGLDPDERELVRLALEDRFSPRLDRFGRAELHALFNIAYVHAANAVGPVLADKLLTQAVHAVEAMPEGAAYAPRRLL